MKTVAFIPVRGGSKSIPGKNIKPLGGRPLLHWTLEAATEAQSIDQVFVSSDSEEILSCARSYGHDQVVAIERPAEFATDTASTESAMLDFARQHDFDRIVLIQATSPLTTAADLDGALAHMDEVGAQSLLSGTHEFRFRWGGDAARYVTAENYEPIRRPRRQDWNGEFMENGAFYVTSREALLRTECRLSGSVAFWIMRAHTAVEIDTLDDWEILEALIQRHRPAKAAQDYRLLITDVDGVLTDGGMYYGPEGEALKKFNTRDGMGLELWRKSGRQVAIVTGENSPAVAARAKKMNITELHLGIQEKAAVVRSIAQRLGVPMTQVAYIGDDRNDLSAMAEVGLVACPSDAHASVQKIAHYRCARPGGGGCVREFVDHLLASASL